MSRAETQVLTVVLGYGGSNPLIDAENSICRVISDSSVFVLSCDCDVGCRSSYGGDKIGDKWAARRLRSLGCCAGHRAARLSAFRSEEIRSLPCRRHRRDIARAVSMSNHKFRVRRMSDRRVGRRALDAGGDPHECTPSLQQTIPHIPAWGNWRNRRGINLHGRHQSEMESSNLRL